MEKDIFSVFLCSFRLTRSVCVSLPRVGVITCVLGTRPGPHTTRTFHVRTYSRAPRPDSTRRTLAAVARYACVIFNLVVLSFEVGCGISLYLRSVKTHRYYL